MLCVRTLSKDPFYNLAVEEYFLKNFKENIFILWQCEPTVLIGRNQNTISEINYAYVKENNINVVRRISGGGAVYCDLGTVLFSYLTNTDKTKPVDFEKSTKVIVQLLATYGIEAKFEGRNDLTIEGKKFSGNATHVFNDRVMHHGTILFDTNIDELSNVLKPRKEKFIDKSTKSTRSRVVNIKEYFKRNISIEDFGKELMAFVKKSHECGTSYKITAEDEEKILTLRNEKYLSWEWNYGKSPDFNMEKVVKTKAGVIEVEMNVQEGILKEVKFCGDFFGVQKIENLQNKLKDCWYKPEMIRARIKNLEIDEYILGLNKEEFINLFF